MTQTKAHSTNDPIIKYIVEHSLRLHAVQESLIQYTTQHPRAGMLGSADELQLLSNLAKYLGAKKTLDIGVFTGYSALSLALALPADGKVIALDVSEEFTNIAKKFWKEAGVDHKIDLHLAPAKVTLQKLLDQGESGTFDYAFIDADKDNYDSYYEYCLKLLRPGGLIALDNMLWSNKVIDDTDQTPDTVAIRKLNAKIAKDNRVDISLLQVGDGTMLAFKKY